MIKEIIFFILLFFISFIPILIWGYFFGYVDNEEFNKKRFLIGIFAGGISVIPVLYLGDLIDSTGINLLNIFLVVHSFKGFFEIFNLFLSFLFILILFSGIPYLIFYFTPISKDKIKIYFLRFWVFSLYFLIISFIFYILSVVFDNFSLFNFETKISNISFGNLVFNSFKLIIFYYIIIAILEEISKFFCFCYSKNNLVYSYKESIIYAIFIALGFSFVENMLYFKSLYNTYGMGSELITTYFMRNIFSIFLHILCGTIFAYYFSILYFKYKNKYNFDFIKLLFLGFFLSIFFHMAFDIFLTFNLTFFVFVYVLGGYFYLTYIFYKE